MPLYEYECKKCGHRFERILKFSDPPVKTCPQCKGKVEQMISAPAVRFKGSVKDVSVMGNGNTVLHAGKVGDVSDLGSGNAVKRE